MPVDVPVGASVLCYQGDDCELEGDAANVDAVNPISSALVPASTESLDPRLFDNDEAPPAEDDVDADADAEAAPREPRPPLEVAVGDEVRVFDFNEWWTATVLAVDHDMALVHFKGCKSLWDKWIELVSDWIALPDDVPAAAPEPRRGSRGSASARF